MSKKMLFLKRSYDRNAQVIVDGAVKLFLKPDYQTKQMVVVRNVTNNNGEPRTVANLTGDLKLDEFMARQIEFLFGAQVPVGEFLNVRVGLWGKLGEAIAKFNLNEKDLYMFLLSNATLNSFPRNNGNTGFQLNCTAYDFEALHTAGSGNGNGNNRGNAAQPTQAQQYAPQQAQQYAPRAAQPAQQNYNRSAAQPVQQYAPQQPVQQQYAPAQTTAAPVQQYAPRPAAAQQQPPQAQQYAPRPVQPTAPQPQANTMVDDYAAIEESEDLPF